MTNNLDENSYVAFLGLDDILNETYCSRVAVLIDSVARTDFMYGDFDSEYKGRLIKNISPESPALFGKYNYILSPAKLIFCGISKENKNEFIIESRDFSEKNKFIKVEHRFQIIKYIILMLCEEVNDVGPVNYQIPFNEKWIEIEHNKIYYYLRKMVFLVNILLN